jgi:hypothetical protein
MTGEAITAGTEAADAAVLGVHPATGKVDATFDADRSDLLLSDLALDAFAETMALRPPQFMHWLVSAALQAFGGRAKKDQ